MKTPKQQEEKWEKRFDELFNMEDVRVPETIKSFISQLLTDERKKYDKIFKWLCGEDGDFPDLSQKPHYRFRNMTYKPDKEKEGFTFRFENTETIDGVDYITLVPGEVLTEKKIEQIGKIHSKINEAIRTATIEEIRGWVGKQKKSEKGWPQCAGLGCHQNENNIQGIIYNDALRDLSSYLDSLK